jgi:hypothetical protein
MATEKDLEDKIRERAALLKEQASILPRAYVTLAEKWASEAGQVPAGGMPTLMRGQAGHGLTVRYRCVRCDDLMELKVESRPGPLCDVCYSLKGEVDQKLIQYVNDCQSAFLRGDDWPPDAPDLWAPDPPAVPYPIQVAGGPEDPEVTLRGKTEKMSVWLAAIAQWSETMGVDVYLIKWSLKLRDRFRQEILDQISWPPCDDDTLMRIAKSGAANKWGSVSAPWGKAVATQKAPSILTEHPFGERYL